MASEHNLTGVCESAVVVSSNFLSGSHEHLFFTLSFLLSPVVSNQLAWKLHDVAK